MVTSYPGQPSRLLVFQPHAEIYFTFCDTAARDILGKFSAIRKLSRNVRSVSEANRRDSFGWRERGFRKGLLRGDSLNARRQRNASERRQAGTVNCKEPNPSLRRVQNIQETAVAG